ncbi:hypothetical protein [[Eubacterium] cellulosolvens]
MVANVTGGKIYFVRYNQRYFDIYDPIGKSWGTSSNCADTITATGHAITLAGSDIYTTTNTNKLYRYHTNNNTWIDLGALPTSATLMTYGGLTYDQADRIYAIQYRSGASTAVAFYYYAISNSTWFQLKSPLSTDCTYPTLCYFENRVYLMNKTSHWTSSPAGKHIQFYAPNNNTWFRLTAAPIGVTTRLCTDNYNLFGTTNEGQILKYDVMTDSWATTGKKTSSFITVMAGLAYSDRMFYLCKYNPSPIGYFNLTGVGGGNLPVNSSLDIGDNGGLPEWNITGEFNTTNYVSDFTSEVNNLLTTTSRTYIDEYGNEFVDIVINITSENTSEFMIRKMKINYTYTEVVDYNPFTGNLLTALNELVPDTGEGDIILPIRVYSSIVGSINISNISIDYYIPDLTNIRCELTDGHGIDGKIIYADYMNHTFSVNVTNRQGYLDVKDVILYFDPNGEDLQLLWDEATDTFSKLRDPENLIALDVSSCTSSNNGVDNWTLEFVVRFDWAYPNETLDMCALKTTNDTSASVYNEFTEVYRVENDLEFVGTLEVTAALQGNLTSKPALQHWVKSNEGITWENLTVVYEGTTNFYPADKNFNVTVFDDDNGAWVNKSSSGKPFVIQTVSDATSDYNDIHTINITNIPGVGEDVSDWQFLIRTDNDGPLAPLNFICHADGPYSSETDYDDDTEIFVTWNNPGDDVGSGEGSGVDYFAMEFNNPLPIKEETTETSLNGTEGLSTFYVRARDNVGNWGTIASASIFIDLTNLTFSTPVPEPDSWQTSLTVTCGVTILDTAGSGVDLNTIQYRYIEEGDINTADWRNYDGPGVSGETVVCVQNITFETDGEDKKVQWRAKDIAGNGRVVMDPPHQFKIDSSAPTIKYIQPDFTKWLATKTPEIKFYLNDTDGSGMDLTTLEYSMSTTGPDGLTSWKVLSGVGGGDSILCTISDNFEDGIQNYIKVRARDIAGNQMVFNPRQLKIDTNPVEFINPVPAPEAWTNTLAVKCNITIRDPVSSVLVDTIKYQFSTNGTGKYEYWRYAQDSEITADPDGHTFYLSTIVNFKDGVNNYIRWTALDLAGNEIISNDYQVLVDVTPIEFTSPLPTEEQWRNSLTVPCSVEMFDIKGSGILGKTIQYSFSTNGLGRFGPWTNEGLEYKELEGTRARRSNGNSIEVFESVFATAKPKFAAGSSNYIKWRAKDQANNLVTSDSYQVNVDLDEVFFLNPEPKEDITYNELELRCKITVVDIGGSGVNPEKVEYRYSGTGLAGFREWTSEEITPDKADDKLFFFVDVQFNPGNQNKLQWRAMDNAGNGPTESKIFNITINSPPVVVIDEPKESGSYGSDSNIFFSANSTFDPDPDDMLSYEWSSNISKYLGNTKAFYHTLPAGVHKITLTVADNHGHSVAVDKVITVSKYYPDFDNDGIPDYLDNDDDNDKFPDTADAFPLDPSEWKDTDADGIGNNKDTDDDGDNIPDIEDAYPENPDKWKKEKAADTSMMMYLMLMVIIIIIIIGAAAGAIRHRHKKQAALAAETAEAMSKIPATTMASTSLGAPRIQEAQVEMVSAAGERGVLGTAAGGTGVPLLPGTVQPGYASTTSTAASPEKVPQHLVGTTQREIPTETVQTYMPQASVPTPTYYQEIPAPQPEDQVQPTTTPETPTTPPQAQPESVPSEPGAPATAEQPQPQAQPSPQPTIPPEVAKTQVQETKEPKSRIPGLTPEQQKAQSGAEQNKNIDEDDDI